MSAKLEEICPAGPKRTSMLDTMKSKFDALDKILETNGEGKLFVMGDTLSFADLQIASFLFFFKLMVEEQEWEEVAGWNDGRWRKLMEALKQYEEGVGDESEAWKPE